MNNSPYHNNEPMFNKTMFSFDNKMQTRITNDPPTGISTPFQKQQQNLLNQRVSQDSIHSFSKKRIYNEMNNWLNSYNISNILITETAVNEYFESIKVSKDIELHLFEYGYCVNNIIPNEQCDSFLLEKIKYYSQIITLINKEKVPQQFQFCFDEFYFRIRCLYKIDVVVPIHS